MKCRRAQGLVDHLHCGDNLPLMAGLPDGCCDLIYIDPPFFTGKARTTRGPQGGAATKESLRPRPQGATAGADATGGADAHALDIGCQGLVGMLPVRAPAPPERRPPLTSLRDIKGRRGADATPTATRGRGPLRSPRGAGATRGAATYSDQWAGGLGAYLAFMQPRLEQCRRLLAAHGTLYVHLDWRAAHYVRVELDGIFGRENFLNEIVWQYRTGGVSRRWFGRKHDTILAYARRLGRHRFHVQRDGEFRTDGLKYDEQGRPYKSTRQGRLYFHAEGPAMTDVWDIPFLSTVSRERTGWPTQKPLRLLERIIRASSDAGDLVADFFCGSGTTLVAAQRSGRRYLGCDLSAEAVRIARSRLSE